VTLYSTLGFEKHLTTLVRGRK